MNGLRATVSNAGLMARQLITQMGGVDGTRAFKIPGVRRLIREHGPNASFTRRTALQHIGGRDPSNPDAKFDDHKQLFIEPRPFDQVLTPQMVFSHLVEKGLSRMGADLTCPVCRLASWVPLNQLRQRLSCDLCGADYDATRQLVEGESTFRRTGVLGLQKDVQGAVPVALLLQQLSTNLSPGRGEAIFSPSIDVEPIDGGWERCEIDFFAMMPGWRRSTISQVVFGEVKDRGGSLDANDVENLQRVAATFPMHRYEVFILLAKLDLIQALAEWATQQPDRADIAALLPEPSEDDDSQGRSVQDGFVYEPRASNFCFPPNR